MTAVPVPSADVRRRSAVVLGTCAVLVPLMVAGGFALLAVVPLAVVVRRTWTTPGLRRLRPWAAVLAVTYVVPLVQWAVLPDRAPSLTKDMHPVTAAVVVAAGVAHLVALLVEWRRGRRA